MSARVVADAALPPPSADAARPQAWPPPPHDPRERDLVLRADGWEIRLFGEHEFQYFVRHGFAPSRVAGARVRAGSARQGLLLSDSFILSKMD